MTTPAAAGASPGNVDLFALASLQLWATLFARTFT
jgi:hypothetical protein